LLKKIERKDLLKLGVVYGTFSIGMALIFWWLLA